MFPSAAQVGAQSPQPLARRMMDEAGAQVISLAAQAGAAALAIASSPAAASAARPGAWVWMVSFIIAPPLRAPPRHGGWSGSGGGRARPPTRGIASASSSLDVYQVTLGAGQSQRSNSGNHAPWGSLLSFSACHNARQAV